MYKCQPVCIQWTAEQRAALIASGNRGAVMTGIPPPDWEDIIANGLVLQSSSYTYEEDDAV